MGADDGKTEVLDRTDPSSWDLVPLSDLKIHIGVIGYRSDQFAGWLRSQVVLPEPTIVDMVYENPAVRIEYIQHPRQADGRVFDMLILLDGYHQVWSREDFDRLRTHVKRRSYNPTT